MRIAEELRIALARATSDAHNRHHEYLTLEHLLLALLHDPDTAEMLEACGGHLRALEKELDLYLDQDVERLPEGEEQSPEQTNAFAKVFQRSASHALSSNKEILTGPIVLVELMKEEESYAKNQINNDKDIQKFIEKFNGKIKSDTIKPSK